MNNVPHPEHRMLKTLWQHHDVRMIIYSAGARELIKPDRKKDKQANPEESYVRFAEDTRIRQRFGFQHDNKL